MKKLLTAILATGLLLSVLAGCNGGGTPAIPASSGSNGTGSTDASEPASSLEEQTFSVPQDGTQLNLHISPIMSAWLDAPIERYKTLYPDVEVIIDNNNEGDWGQDSETLRTELMAGRGPDLIYNPQTCFLDVNKVMKGNVLTDLNPFLDRDPDFRKEDFYELVMKVGQYQGKQMVMPLIFNTDLLLSSEPALAEAGFDISKCGDYLGLAEQVETYLKTGKEPRVYNSLFYGLQFPSYLGLDYVNYEKNTVDFSQPELKKAAELYKPLYKQDCPTVDTVYSSTLDGCEDVIGREAVFGTYSYGNGDMVFLNASAISATEVPVLLPVVGADGKGTAKVEYAAAINSNSKNQMNAYRFLKVLMSEEWQNVSINMINLSIRKSGLEARITQMKEETNNQSIGGGGDENAKQWALPPLPDSFYEQYRKAVDNIGHASFNNDYMHSQIGSYLTPYFLGEKSMDACLQDLTGAMEIYLSE